MEVEFGEKPIIISDLRKVFIPTHRRSPLKSVWAKVYRPLVDFLKLQVRYNINIDVQDAVALIRLNELYVESFSVTDIKPLKGDHLSRAIGRIAGSGGKMRYTLENASKTRIIIADSRVHILGSYESIQVARNAICDLVLGAGPSKTIGEMGKITSKLNSKF
ncbi:hypothetical protein MXB_2136 [Myxobolus squamalis]|nr:hypothetical protein MXB_2136 [Myxobolus squamalis]